MGRASLWCLWVFLFAASPAFAGPGADFIQKNIPELYYAVAERIGYDQAVEYFDEWTTRDMESYRSKVRYAYYQTRDGLEVLPSPKTLRDRFLVLAATTFGEIEGNQRMRALASEVPGTVYMHDSLYEKANGEVRRPDGLNYRIEKGRLIITKVLESKMGRSSFDSDQAKGYLAAWRKPPGLTVYDRTGRRLTFGPDAIDLLVEGQIVPVRAVSLEDLRKTTLLVGTKKESSFSGEYHRCLFDNEVYNSIADEFLENVATRFCDRALSRTYQNVEHQLN